MITETDFHKKADHELTMLYEKIENIDKENLLDLDLLNEVLHVSLPDGKQYIINKHTASRQIWVSSPISSANHFSLNKDQDIWISRKNQELRSMILDELISFMQLK